MSALARLAHRRPWPVLLAILALTALGVAASGVVSSRLSNQLSDYDNPASASAQARAEVQRATGIDLEEGYTLLVRLDVPVTLSSPAPTVVSETVALLHQRPEVVSTIDAWSAGLPELISRDGRSAIVGASLRPVDEVTAVHALQTGIDANPLLRGHVLLGGPTALSAQGNDQSLNDLTFSETIALPILAVLLLIIFGSVVAASLPLLGAAVSIGLTTLGLLVAASLTHVSVYALNLVYALGIGLSIDFSLLIVSRYREELSRSGPGLPALARTLSTAGRTVLFSAATVTAALGTLLLFPIPAISSMGLAGMMVTVAAAVAAVLAMPALLSLLGTRVEALRVRPRPRPASTESGFWARLAHGVMRRPLIVAAVGAAALLTAGSPGLGVQFTGYSTTQLPLSLPAAQVDAALSSSFTDVTASPLVLVIDAGPSSSAAVASYAASVARVSGVAGVAPPVLIAAHTWEIDATLSGDPSSAPAMATLTRVEAIPTTLNPRATGSTADFVDFQSSLARHLPEAALLLALTTLVVLFVMTGSALLPVMALVMNAFTLVATLGLVVLVFQDGFLRSLLGFRAQGAIDELAPVLTAALAFGLSTDYGVFLLSRIREAHLAGLPTRGAVALGLQRVGRVVTSAAALFCIAVGALVLSQTVSLKEIGLGGAVAVLIDATVVRALLVPALMALLGRWSWWAPRPLAGLHRRLGLHRLEPRAAVDEPATA